LMLKETVTLGKVLVQAAEDQHDLDVAKLEALAFELAECREELGKAMSERSADAATARARYEAEMNTRLAETIDAMREELLSKHKTEILAARAQVNESICPLYFNESMYFQAAQEATDVAVSNEKAIRLALEAAQSELRKELDTTREANVELSAKMRQVESDHSKMKTKLAQERHTANLWKAEVESLSNMSKSRTNDIEAKYHKELRHLEQEIVALTDAKNSLESRVFSAQAVINDLESQLREEKAMRDSVTVNHTELINDRKILIDQLKQLQDDLTASRREVEDWSKKYHLSAQHHDSELNRIQKRNQVLADTVTKLTAQGDADLSASRADYLRAVSSKTSDLVGITDDTDRMWSYPAQRSVAQPQQQYPLHRGQSAPAALVNSVEKQKSSKGIHLDLDLADDEACGIQVIDTHRDGDALRQLQIEVEEYNSNLGSSNNSATKIQGLTEYDATSSVTKSRAKTAPLQRTVHVSDKPSVASFSYADQIPSRVGDRTKDIEPAVDIISDDQMDTDLRLSARASSQSIDRIQSAINQRRVQLQSRQKVVNKPIRNATNDDHILAALSDSVQQLALQRESRESPRTPVRAKAGFASAEWNENSSSTDKREQLSSSQSFIRKLRTSVEDGENHWIPFSPQPAKKQSSQPDAFEENA
jgi:hypothetical protein